MKEIRMMLFCVIICIATGAIVYFSLAKQQKKIAVVDAVKMFDGYNMKKEVEEIEKVKLQRLSKQLDSINNLLQKSRILNNNEDDVKKLSYSYGYMKTKLDEEYAQSNRDINEQVWKRLNPMLDEYGKKEGLHLIIGANGMGSVLYTDEYYDITNDVIEYVNKRYAQGN